MTNRRDFIKKGLMAGVGMALIPDIVQAALTSSPYGTKTSAITIPDNATILFQGDSITDNGRNRENEDKVNDRSMLGNGYAMFAAADLLCSLPEKNLQIYNRGISGNKVYQLEERWEKDCIHLKPDVLSILIGINDLWHTLSERYDSTPKKYEENYRRLLTLTRQHLPDTQLVVGEPFTIKGGRALNERWYPEVDHYREVARKIAIEFNAIFIPYQKVFDTALEKAPVSYWGADGVHPSMAGAFLMKEAWLQAVLG